MKCASSSTGAVPRCEHAMAVCKRLPHCTTLDVNVEGSVATLKRETELSRRTSRVKDISVRHVRRVRGARGTRKRLHGLHGWCAEHEVDLPELPQAACALNCPLLNCTRAIGLCYSTSSCTGVDISFQLAGRDAVAVLRRSTGAV